MDVQENSKTMAEIINVTDAAKHKMAELIEGADADIEAVRVFVSGGGCGGMNYGMTFADRLDERDRVFTGDVGFRLYMDPWRWDICMAPRLTTRTMASMLPLCLIMCSRVLGVAVPVEAAEALNTEVRALPSSDI